MAKFSNIEDAEARFLEASQFLVYAVGAYTAPACWHLNRSCLRARRFLATTIRSCSASCAHWCNSTPFGPATPRDPSAREPKPSRSLRACRPSCRDRAQQQRRRQGQPGPRRMVTAQALRLHLARHSVCGRPLLRPRPGLLTRHCPACCRRAQALVPVRLLLTLLLLLLLSPSSRHLPQTWLRRWPVFLCWPLRLRALRPLRPPPW